MYLDFDGCMLAIRPKRSSLPEMNHIHVASLLLERLERIPADSIWAHRASGLRGSLIRMVEQLGNGQDVEAVEMNRLITYGFQILESVAREKTLSFGASKRKAPHGKQIGA